MSTRMSLPLSDLRLDFQPAENRDEDIVQSYVSQIERGKALNPVKVRWDGQDYFLEDGFHRVEAARRCGIQALEAEVSPGTLAEMETEFKAKLRATLDRLRNQLAPGGVPR